ncbi:hypothetical protein [Pseudarthrobacter cellobiosi]|uniref:hypothetical protein n=1 Tax=Pseudarthrobacter cellobiosi TaxID=2953654 RepID=UPI0027E38037|nr:MULTISPECIES: hypothetical protein [unclassified Pseudarthrobacter]
MAQQPEVTGRSYPAGVPCWVDTQQPDVEVAMHFYGGIFGWEFEDTAPSGGTGRSRRRRVPHLADSRATRRPGGQPSRGWNFSDLHTTDTEAAVAFYTKAFDWQFDNLDFGTMIRRHPGYGDHLEAAVDPNIRVRQAGDLVPRGFEDAVA